MSRNPYVPLNAIRCIACVFCRIQHKIKLPIIAEFIILTFLKSGNREN